jgi:hypothetical protein
MDRGAVGEAAGGAVEELTMDCVARVAELATRGSAVPDCLPKKTFPGYPSPCDKEVSGHLPVTIMREPVLVMSVRRTLTALGIGVLVCGAAIPAQAQSAAPKPSTGAAKPVAAKPVAAKPVAAKPAAISGGAEPTLIGQFGTWGAYTATPNGKKVCFALAKP